MRNNNGACLVCTGIENDRRLRVRGGALVGVVVVVVAEDGRSIARFLGKPRTARLRREFAYAGGAAGREGNFLREITANGVRPGVAGPARPGETTEFTRKTEILRFVGV